MEEKAGLPLKINQTSQAPANRHIVEQNRWLNIGNQPQIPGKYIDLIERLSRGTKSRKSGNYAKN